MTAKAKKEGNRGAPKKKMSKGTYNATSQGALDASAETASQAPPGASPEMISSGRGHAGELNENVLTASTKSNTQASMVLQNLFQEWSQFVGMRMRQNMHLIQTIQGCRSFPDMQQAYTQFWQNAFTEYGEETRRMLRIIQGAVDDASDAAHGNGATKATLH
jgi:Phasin protein